MFIPASLASVVLLSLNPSGQAAIDNPTLHLHIAFAQGQTSVPDESTDNPTLYRGSGR